MLWNVKDTELILHWVKGSVLWILLGVLSVTNLCLLQYNYNTTTIQLQYNYNTTTIQLQYNYNTTTIQLQYNHNTTTI